MSVGRKRREAAVVWLGWRAEHRHFRRLAERWLGRIPVLLIPGLRGLHGLRCIIVGQR